MAAFGKTINKVTGFHDKIDPFGKKFRDPIEDAVGLPRSGEVGTALFGDPDAKPEMPEIQKAAVMPGADDEQISRAKRRSFAAQRKAQGRSSTILSDNSETLG